MSINEFMSFLENYSEEDFLKDHFITDESGCNGWRFKGKFTTDIEEAKKWME